MKRYCSLGWNFRILRCLNSVCYGVKLETMEGWFHREYGMNTPINFTAQLNCSRNWLSKIHYSVCLQCTC